MTCVPIWLLALTCFVLVLISWRLVVLTNRNAQLRDRLHLSQIKELDRLAKARGMNIDSRPPWLEKRKS